MPLLTDTYLNFMKLLGLCTLGGVDAKTAQPQPENAAKTGIVNTK